MVILISRMSLDKTSSRESQSQTEKTDATGVLSASDRVKARQEAFAAAYKVDPGPDRWSARALYLYLSIFVSSMCASDSGFDGTVMSSVNGMEQYLGYFGLPDTGSSSTSIIFGIFTIGSLCGCIPASYIPDKFGRRTGMFCGNLLLCAGAIITGQAKTMNMLVGGRFLTGFGATFGASCAKSYVAEIAPAARRGLCLGLLNTFYFVGSISATGMVVATQRWSTEWSWRLPFFIQMAPGAVNVLFILFCPESPRWLYTVGKPEAARRVLALLHSRTNDVNSPLIQHEMDEIAEHVAVDGPDKRWWDFRPLFRTHADRYRFGMILMIGVFGQLAGNGLSTYFLPALLKQAGVTSQTTRLTLNFVNAVVSFAFAILGSSIVDHFGRRRLLLSANTGIVACWVIIAILTSDTADVRRGNAGIAFIYIFGVIYSLGWTPMQAVYVGEVLGYSARAKGIALQFVSSSAAGCINTFGMAKAIGVIKWKVYLIFSFWTAFQLAVMWYFMVETKGLTLEEIEEVFQQPNPKKFSVEHNFKMRKRSQSEEDGGDVPKSDDRA